MGGRGIGSGRRGNTGGGDQRFGSLKPLPLAGQTAFDRNGRNLGTQASIDKWETKNATLDHEQLLMVNSDGYAVAYFDGDKDSVAFAIPRGVDASDITLTHVHPAYYDRDIGGTFSEADLVNHIRLGLKETRAVSVEGTYVFRAEKGANPRAFLRALARRESDTSSAINKAVKAKEKSLGRKLTEKEYSKIFLDAHDRWLKTHATGHGYYYKLEKN